MPPPGPRFYFAIFLDVQRILHHLSEVPSQLLTSPLPWSAWGEAATRWNSLCDSDPTYPISKAHGSHFVTVRWVGDDRFTELIVADFNPVLARRSKMRDSDQEGHHLPGKDYDAATDGKWPYFKPDLETRRTTVDYVDESRPTVIKHISYPPIISRLPYRVTIVSGPAVVFDDWMIDGDRLVGVKVKDGSQGEDGLDRLVTHYIRS